MNVERARNTFELITAMQEKKVASTMQIWLILFMIPATTY